MSKSIRRVLVFVAAVIAVTSFGLVGSAGAQGLTGGTGPIPSPPPGI